MFKYPKVFHYNNESEFKSNVTKLLEKCNVDIRRATTEYKYTHSFCRSLDQKASKIVV